MISKEELKKEVDKLPEALLEEVYSLLKQVAQPKKSSDDGDWGKWKSNLEKFSPDFMDTRQQTTQQIRESFDWWVFFLTP